MEQTSEKHEENQDNVNEKGCKKREDEDINTVDVGDSYEVSMMIGYINNLEIAAGEEKVEESVNMKGTVESNGVLESEEDKQCRMDVIGQSLIISKLEDELDNELKMKFNVKNTEERIRRLKEVLGLLKTSEIKSNDTQKEDSKQSTSAVKDNIDMKSEQDFVKCSVGTEEEEKEEKDI